MKKVVIKNEPKEVNLEDVDENKIYVFFTHENIYKLQKIDVCYQFVNLLNSKNSFGFSHESYIKVIKDMIHTYIKVYEFDNIKEFSKWCLKVIKD